MGRDSFVAALGGGVAGDIAGFAAATYMRGVPLIQIPTSLIAQVDSSVGGKTAVDHPKGKNLIGAFHQPKLVVVDVGTLKTLPAREFAAGIAEVMRYGVIASEGLFRTLETRMADILRRDTSLMTEIAAECCAIKARIVEQDERESGLRATLNYGHTFGHALETVTSYKRFLHGEAVGVGMICAAEMSAARGLVDREFCDRHRALLHSAGLPSAMPSDVEPTAMVDAMKMDKKAVVSSQGVQPAIHRQPKNRLRRNTQRLRRRGSAGCHRGGEAMTRLKHVLLIHGPNLAAAGAAENGGLRDDNVGADQRAGAEASERSGSAPHRLSIEQRRGSG